MNNLDLINNILIKYKNPIIKTNLIKYIYRENDKSDIILHIICENTYQILEYVIKHNILKINSEIIMFIINNSLYRYLNTINKYHPIKNYTHLFKYNVQLSFYENFNYLKSCININCLHPSFLELEIASLYEKSSINCCVLFDFLQNNYNLHLLSDSVINKLYLYILVYVPNEKLFYLLMNCINVSINNTDNLNVYQLIYKNNLFNLIYKNFNITNETKQKIYDIVHVKILYDNKINNIIELYKVINIVVNNITIIPLPLQKIIYDNAIRYKSIGIINIMHSKNYTMLENPILFNFLCEDENIDIFKKYFKSHILNYDKIMEYNIIVKKQYKLLNYIINKLSNYFIYNYLNIFILLIKNTNSYVFKFIKNKNINKLFSDPMVINYAQKIFLNIDLNKSLKPYYYLLCYLINNQLLTIAPLTNILLNCSTVKKSTEYFEYELSKKIITNKLIPYDFIKHSKRFDSNTFTNYNILNLFINYYKLDLKFIFKFNNINIIKYICHNKYVYLNYINTYTNNTLIYNKNISNDKYYLVLYNKNSIDKLMNIVYEKFKLINSYCIKDISNIIFNKMIS